MKIFMLKALFLAAFMFVSVLFGMQQANDGIQQMRGFDDPNYEEAITIQEAESGELQASILGNEVSSHDLQKKREQLEEMEAYNFFSSLGKQFSATIQALMEETIQLITSLINGE